MSLINQLNEIFSYLIDENKYQKRGITNKACYWKMGTSFFTMLDRLLENIKNEDISFPLICNHNNKDKTVEGNNATYNIMLNNKNVTPIVGSKKGNAALNTMTQYIRSLIGFGIATTEVSLKPLKKFVENQGKLILVSNCKEILKEENRINLIINLLVKSTYSNVEFQRDIAYSILFEVLNTYQFDYSLLNEKYQLFSFIKITKRKETKGHKVMHLVNDLEKIKKDIYIQGTKGTYKEIVQCIKNNFNSLESFISCIYLQMQSLNDLAYEEIERQQEIINLKAQLKVSRSQFKNNIFQDRKNKNLISTKQDLYSDLFADENTNLLLRKFNEAEAAHIYEFSEIKNEVLTKINDSVIDLASNPNNGLIMPVEYHKSFDRGLWFFDINGNMIIPFDNQEYIINNLKLTKIKIRKEVFNDEMKKFLMIRKT